MEEEADKEAEEKEPLAKKAENLEGVEEEHKEAEEIDQQLIALNNHLKQHLLSKHQSMNDLGEELTN